MARTPSSMLPLGTPMPPFELRDVSSGRLVAGSATGQPGTLVMFISNHCPYVRHIVPVLVGLANAWVDRGLRVIAIGSNSIETHPEDGPDELRRAAESMGWRFDCCFDPTQQVARDFTARCTPDFFLFDGGGRLFYRGQFDDARPGSPTPVTGSDLAAAVDALLAGGPSPVEQWPSLGCNIKWHPGTEPPDGL